MRMSEVHAVESRKIGSVKPATKREKFKALAEARTINAIKSIRVIGKLGNPSAYDYDESDVKKITNALSREVDALRARLTSRRNKESVDFEL
jgi:hypothetical protein